MGHRDQPVPTYCDTVYNKLLTYAVIQLITLNRGKGQELVFRSPSPHTIAHPSSPLWCVQVIQNMIDE